MDELKFKVPYSYCESSGKMSMSAVTTVFQDIGAAHHFGYDLKRQREMGIFWVILSWRIQAERFPEFDETVYIRTYLNHMDKFLARRTYSIVDADGKTLVVATSNSVLCSAETKHPMRFEGEFLAKHVIDNEKACDFMPLSNRTKCDFSECGSFVVRKYDVDTNYHMNNISYIRNAVDHIAFEPKYMQIYYENPTFLGDTIDVHKGELDGKTVIKLTKDGQLLAVVKFSA